MTASRNSTKKKRPGEAKASAAKAPAPKSVLVLDIGGSKIKMLATGQTEPRKVPSGKHLTPAHLVEAVRRIAQDWQYEGVSIGYPGLVGADGPRSEPGNLNSGWVGFDFGAAFGLPVRIINDAAMQALGSYEGGRMLFLGLGTGLGSALIADHVIVPLELGRLWHDDRETIGEALGRSGMKRLGKPRWREIARQVVMALSEAFAADYVVIGGGNAKELKELPPGCRRGHNLTAFRGGFRLWSLDTVATLSAEGHQVQDFQLAGKDWHLI